MVAYITITEYMDEANAYDFDYYGIARKRQPFQQRQESDG
jgi:hypothetical protein